MAFSSKLEKWFKNILLLEPILFSNFGFSQKCGYFPKLKNETLGWNATKIMVNHAWCLKITEKSHRLKIPKMVQFGGPTMLPDRSTLKGQKLVENAKIQMRHFK